MDDLISRQAAIEALENSRFPGASYIDQGILIALREIKSLPTAQKRTETHACDYISRQAAIDALEKLSANYTGVGKREWHPHVRECQYEIQHMPSAQPDLQQTYNRLHQQTGGDCIGR